MIIDGKEILNKINGILENLKNSNQKIYKNYFQEYYSYPESISSQEIIDLIEDPVVKLNIISHHSSKSLDTFKGKLDYKGNIRNYIVIGGNRLSRGLTLEGLTTSYFVDHVGRILCIKWKMVWV